MRSGNPVLKPRSFESSSALTERMTLNGTVNKTAMLLAIVLASAMWTWGKFFQTQDSASVSGLMLIGIVGGLIMALVTIFFKKASPFTAPAYAVFEGLAIGGISAIFEMRYPGIVIQAVGLTFGTMICLLAAYRSGLIKATENFKLGIVAATGAIALLYLVDIVLSLFHMPIGFIHEGGIFGILFSVVVVTIAALNLVLDFDFIEESVNNGSPKYMEWYAAFGLLVTLVWLYMEILRLLSKLQSRN